MKIKIVLTVIVLLACFFCSLYETHQVYPNIEADLAIRAVTDAESQVNLRMFQDTQNHWWLVRLVGCGCCLSAIWWPKKKLD